jgi:hypothetical protein
VPRRDSQRTHQRQLRVQLVEGVVVPEGQGDP